MDQRVLSEIGNIYACEMLYKAGINHQRLAEILMEDDWKKLFCYAGELLKTAIKKRGSSIFH
jgi:formamidopyrimidine-DNA glycosylase